MTTKEKFEVIANTETLDAEIREWATERIAALDAARAKEQERRAAKKAEDNELREAVRATLNDMPQTSTDVQIAISDQFTASIQKVSRVLQDFVKEGVAVETTVKGEKGKRKAYTLA